MTPTPPTSSAHPEHRGDSSDLSESVVALGSAVNDLLGQIDRLTTGLQQRSAAPASPPPTAPERRPPQRHGPMQAISPQARNRSVPSRGQPLWASLLAALALLGSVALLDVNFVVAAVVAVAAAVVLQVRWWMLGLAALTLAGIVAIDSQVGEGHLADELAAFSFIFFLMALGLVLYEVWERLSLGDS